MSYETDTDERDIQESDNGNFDHIGDFIKKYLPEFVLGLALVLTNSFQWYKNRKEKKRHEKVERLQKESIKKQDAEINNLTKKAETAEHLATVNDALVKAFKEKSLKGGNEDEQEGS